MNLIYEPRTPPSNYMSHARRTLDGGDVLAAVQARHDAVVADIATATTALQVMCAACETDDCEVGGSLQTGPGALVQQITRLEGLHQYYDLALAGLGA